jgi:DNA-binding transcriptional regulator GbsR (MarR family)
MSSKPSPSSGRTGPSEPEDTLDPSEAGASTAVVPFEGLDHQLADELPTFELFFKTFGFKRVHGRIWGLLVLAGQPLSSREISESLSLSQGSTSTAVNELVEWGAVSTEFDSSRRCHLHSPVRNTLAIVATVIRRREQVVFSQFKQASSKTLAYVTQRYGDKDPRVLTLRSIVSTCEIAEAVMNLVVSSVANALDDSQSLLHKAISAALRVGAVPGRLLIPGPRERFAEPTPDRPRPVAGPGLDLPPTQDREAAGGR